MMKDGLEMALQYIKGSKFMCVTYIKVVSHTYPSLVPRPSSSVEGGSGDEGNPYP